jgi:hypothetical protein
VDLYRQRRLQRLLNENDLAAEAFSRTEEGKAWIARAQRVEVMPSEPVIAIGAHCDTPFACGFYYIIRRSGLFDGGRRQLRWPNRDWETRKLPLAIGSFRCEAEVHGSNLNDCDDQKRCANGRPEHGLTFLRSLWRRARTRSFNAWAVIATALLTYQYRQDVARRLWSAAAGDYGLRKATRANR